MIFRPVQGSVEYTLLEVDCHNSKTMTDKTLVTMIC